MKSNNKIRYFISRIPLSESVVINDFFGEYVVTPFQAKLGMLNGMCQIQSARRKKVLVMY